MSLPEHAFGAEHTDPLASLIGYAQPTPSPVRVDGTDLDVRDTLLQLAALQAESKRVAVIGRAVADRYAERLRRIEEAVDFRRNSIEAWLLADPDRTASFPDAGTAYLATLPKALEVEDEGKFDAWAIEQGYTKPTAADRTEAKKAALARAEDTGELPPGAKVRGEAQAVRVKLA